MIGVYLHKKIDEYSAVYKPIGESIKRLFGLLVSSGG